jgi:hypothetical protein
MRFLYADSFDMVDPRYDFVRDLTAFDRDVFNDDVFAHQILKRAPYDGLLLSYATVGGVGDGGARMPFARRMRFMREGMRRFYRLTEPRYRNLWLMGDCGAFSYASEPEPRYSLDEILAYYEDGQFTHGCSIDHVIFEHEPGRHDRGGGTEEARRRYEITLANAEAFLRASRDIGRGFTPMGAVQGWSPGSMAEAAIRLVRMGYKFLAIGGMVPLKGDEIVEAVAAVHQAVPDAQLHVLGCAKVEFAPHLAKLGVVSLDSSTPMLRAFKDARKNYYLADAEGRLDAYTAIRVASVLESTALMNLARMGIANQEKMQAVERAALDGLRAYGERRQGLIETLQDLADHQDRLIDRDDPRYRDTRIKVPGEASRKGMITRYRRTLEERPWERCGCNICKAAGIHVVLYRGTQVNKRRGFHNMTAFHQAIHAQCDAVNIDKTTPLHHGSASLTTPQQGDLFAA